MIPMIVSPISARTQGGTLATAHKSIAELMAPFTSGFCSKYAAKASRSMCAHGFPSFKNAPESLIRLQSPRMEINEFAQDDIVSLTEEQVFKRMGVSYVV